MIDGCKKIPANFRALENLLDQLKESCKKAEEYYREFKRDSERASKSCTAAANACRIREETKLLAASSLLAIVVACAIFTNGNETILQHFIVCVIYLLFNVYVERNNQGKIESKNSLLRTLSSGSDRLQNFVAQSYQHIREARIILKAIVADHNGTKMCQVLATCQDVCAKVQHQLRHPQ